MLQFVPISEDTNMHVTPNIFVIFEKMVFIAKTHIYNYNNPTKINVFLSHQPFCEDAIERIPKCTPFMNLPTINEIFLIAHWKLLDSS
jgi:hypothetical protein